MMILKQVKAKELVGWKNQGDENSDVPWWYGLLVVGGGGQEEFKKWHLGESLRPQERVGMGPRWLIVLDSVGKVHPYYVTEL